MIQKILVLSDSLAAPRSSEGKDVLKHYETWPYLLRESFTGIEVAQVSVGHATVDFVLAQCKYWLPFNPDLVIVQAGINDCIPRALHKYEIEILKKLDRFYFGKKMSDQIHKRRIWLRDKRNISYTCKAEFRKQVSGFKDHFNNVFFINMIYDKNKNLRQFANKDQIKNTVDIYNSLIRHEYQTNLIDISGVPSDFVLDDGFHLNHTGHQFVLSELMQATGLDSDPNRKCYEM
ncbi:MAG: lysophospholipase L1-like esterase [Parvicella sp.]